MRLWIICIIFFTLCFFSKYNNKLHYFYNQRNALFNIYKFKHFGILIPPLLNTIHPPTLPHSQPWTEVSLKTGIISYLPFITPLLPLSLKASLRTEILVINKLDRSMKYQTAFALAKIIEKPTPSSFSKLLLQLMCAISSCSAMRYSCLFNMILGLFCCLFSQSQNHSNTSFLCPFYPLLKPHDSFPEMHIQFFYSKHTAFLHSS